MPVRAMRGGTGEANEQVIARRVAALHCCPTHTAAVSQHLHGSTRASLALLAALQPTNRPERTPRKASHPLPTWKVLSALSVDSPNCHQRRSSSEGWYPACMSATCRAARGSGGREGVRSRGRV